MLIKKIEKNPDGDTSYMIVMESVFKTTQAFSHGIMTILQ